MSRAAYGGASGVSHKVPKIYGGVNNLSRNVVKGYCGVGGVSRQFWPAQKTTVGARTDFNPGGTYELNTCLPEMAMRFALEFIRKLQKPFLNEYGAYSYYQQKKEEIMADFLSELADNNIVYITNSGSYSSSAVKFYITIYFGKAENLSREINQVYTDARYGNTYASIVDSVSTQKYISYTFDLINFIVQKTTNTIPTSFHRIGLEIGYSSETAVHNVRITNLGMTTYSVELIAKGDWFWHFDWHTGMYDQIDHLKATARDGSESSAIGRNDWLRLPAFIWEKGRTIKVKCERFDPYWEEQYDTLAIEDHGDDFHYYYRTEYSSESGGKHYYKCYYKYYPGGDLMGIQVSNASQSSSGRRGFVVTPTTKPCLANQYIEQEGKVRWVDLYSSTDGGIVGDMTDLAPLLSFDASFNDNTIEFSLGVTAEITPPIMNRYYFYIGQFWQQGTRTYALAGYKVTEIEVT